MSQRRMDLSSEPEARVALSGDQARVEMPARCPPEEPEEDEEEEDERVWRGVPCGRDQILRVASAAAEFISARLDIGGNI